MTKPTAAESAAAGIGLEEAYAVDGPEANRELYASWAETYESVFLAENDYLYHGHVAAAFCGGLDELDGPVLDVGCGTGVVGAELARLGVPVIDGIDISPEMLAKAAAKAHDGRSTYRQLLRSRSHWPARPRQRDVRRHRERWRVHPRSSRPRIGQ